MKRVCRYVFIWALFMIFILSPFSSDAGFLFEFNNGRKVRVEGYRTEGRNYELYLEGGSFRVSREEIKSITEKEDDAVRTPEGETEKDKPETPGDPGEQRLSKSPAPQKTGIES